METQTKYGVGSRGLLIYLVGFNEIAKEFSTLSTFFFILKKNNPAYNGVWANRLLQKSIMHGEFPVAKNIMLSLIFHYELK